MFPNTVRKHREWGARRLRAQSKKHIRNETAFPIERRGLGVAARGGVCAMRKTKKATFEHPRRLCHRTTGRIRVRVVAVQNRPDKACALERLLARDPRLSTVSARPTTGSVIIRAFRHDLRRPSSFLPGVLRSQKWQTPRRQPVPRRRRAAGRSDPAGDLCPGDDLDPGGGPVCGGHPSGPLQAGRSRALLGTPGRAFVVEDGVEIESRVHAVQARDVLAIHATERIPVDGSVISGRALVNEPHITGRAEPVPSRFFGALLSCNR